jgi:hypothetical protein
MEIRPAVPALDAAQVAAPTPAREKSLWQLDSNDIKRNKTYTLSATLASELLQRAVIPISSPPCFLYGGIFRLPAGRRNHFLCLIFSKA